MRVGCELTVVDGDHTAPWALNVGQVLVDFLRDKTR